MLVEFRLKKFFDPPKYRNPRKKKLLIFLYLNIFLLFSMFYIPVYTFFNKEIYDYESSYISSEESK